VVFLLLILLPLCAVCAWGPGHHLEFAVRVLRRRKERLPTHTAQLLGEHRDAYLYGSLAADLITFKDYGGAYSHCHRWSILDDMREHAHTDRGEAFILGYLSHLAADTIAHNHFVPYHLARFARTKGLGHLYWEMSADRFIPEERWQLVAQLKSDLRLAALDEIVNRCVPKKALSMGTNKLLFNHVLLVAERERWRKGMASIHPIAKVRLERGFLRLFQDAAVERIFLGLRSGGLKELMRVDANGKEAQEQAMLTRQNLLERWTSGPERSEHAEARAAGFLEGMQSPPP
jgi:hypothetical protein